MLTAKAAYVAFHPGITCKCLRLRAQAMSALPRTHGGQSRTVQPLSPESALCAVDEVTSRCQFRTGRESGECRCKTMATRNF